MTHQQEEDELDDVGNLMLLATVSCQELENIKCDGIISLSVPTKKRTSAKNNVLEKTKPLSPPSSSSSSPLQHDSQNQREEEIAAVVETPKKQMSEKKKRKCAEVDDIPKKKKKKKKKVNAEAQEERRPTSIPDWVEQLACTHLRNAEIAIWVCDKILQESDTSKHLKRLFIPRASFYNNLMPALTPREEQGVLNGGISVMGLDQEGTAWNLQLKYWPSCKMHVFQKDWIKLVEANGFEAETTLQVWLCRFKEGEDERLCFLIGRKREC